MARPSETKLEQLFRGWLVLYTVGLILCPPIRFHGKLIYSAEWMLFPLLLFAGYEWMQGHWIRPAKSLIALWLGLTAVYFAGKFRGDLAFQISLYKDLNNIANEHFSWVQDGIRWIRWMLLFSLPWLLSHFTTLDPSRIKNLFLRTLKISVMISASLAIVERLGLINLAPIYLQVRDPFWWQDRSYGTFTGPLEASLVYGLEVVFIANEIYANRRKNLITNLAAGVLSLIALKLTFGFSSFVALGITLTSMTFWHGSRWTRVTLACVLAAGTAGVLAFIPAQTILWKLNSLYLRTWTWTSWTRLLPQKPWLIVSGIGFSNLNVDNSCLMMLISGGLLWFIPQYLWTKRVMRDVPADSQFAFLFWLCSWTTLDSVGYWGIGRVMWMLLGIHQIRSLTSLRTEFDSTPTTSQREMPGLKIADGNPSSKTATLVEFL